ncbi:patched family protein, partial [Teladorsagia circumcincta]
HPWPFIIVPSLVTILLSTGIILNFQIVRGVHYLYSPLDARWKTEEAVFGENWAADDDHFYPGKDVLRRRGVYLIVKANDDGNVLRQKHAEQFLQNECFSNRHARLIADVYAKGDQDHFNVTFPLYYTRFATEPVDVGRTLGGVTLHGNRVNSAQAWLVLFQLKHHNPQMEMLSADFKNLVVRAIEAGEAPAPLLDIYYFHSDTFDQELANENRRITPMFSVTFSVLIVFSILCTFNVKWISLPSGMFTDSQLTIPVVDWKPRTSAQPCGGVVNGFLGCVTGIGILFRNVAPLKGLRLTDVRGVRVGSDKSEKLSLTDLAFHMGSVVEEPAGEALNADEEIRSSKSPDSRMWYQKFFEDYYAPFIANRWTVLLALILFGTYVTAATIGSQKVIVGFDKKVGYRPPAAFILLSGKENLFDEGENDSGRSGVRPDIRPLQEHYGTKEGSSGNRSFMLEQGGENGLLKLLTNLFLAVLAS